MEQHPELDLEDPSCRQVLRKTAEEVKIALSSSIETEYTLELPKGISHKGILTAEELNLLLEPLLKRTFESCSKALSDAGLKKGDIEEVVQDCRSLGQFKLRGIPPMKAGFPLVEVSFKVDSNGLLTVSAFEKRSGTEAQIEVIPSHGLTQMEIDAIMEASFEHAVDDFNRRQLIEFQQSAERVFKGIELNWKVAEEVLSENQRLSIRKQMDVVKQTMTTDDAQILKAELDNLGDLTRPLADSAMGRAVLEELQQQNP